MSVTAAALVLMFVGSVAAMAMAVVTAADRMADPWFAKAVAGSDLVAAVYAVLACAVDVDENDWDASYKFEMFFNRLVARAVLMVIVTAFYPALGVLVLLPWQSITDGIERAAYALPREPALRLFDATYLYNQSGRRWMGVLSRPQQYVRTH